MSAESVLSTTAAAGFLKDHGYTVSHTSLETYRVIGGGPAFLKFGRYVRYAPDDLLAWAKSRCSAKVKTTSELPARGHEAA